MASSFTINTADLAFILKQIKIAEDTSIGYTPLTAPKTILQSIMDTYGLSAADAQIAPFGLRTVDGSFNSLVPGQSDFGAADTVFPRLTDPVFRNENDEPNVNPFGVVNENYGVGGNVIDSDPRIISNLVVDMTAGNAAAVEAALNHSVFKGVISEDDIPAAAAAIAAAWALTKSTDVAAAIATGALAGDSTAELLVLRDAALAAYNAAVLADAADAAAAAAALASSNAAASADAASEATAASVFTGPTITADDIAAVGAAVLAASAAATAAAAVVLALPGGVGHPDYAQAVAAATNATALANQLVTLQGAMVLGGFSAIHYVAAATTAALADSNAVDTQLLLTDLTAFVGGDVATTFAAYTAAEAAYTASLNAPAAATAADQALADTLTLYGIEYDSAVGSHVGGFVGSLVIPNLSPDIGLSPGFNSWMTFFGQFFDHGLDLVTKGGNGTVYVPLAADDPLIAGADGVFNTADDLAPHLRFMALTRATPLNGGEENTTTSFVDQNQTYTSDPSHQVFLREYMMTVNGAVSTGKMLDGGTIAGVTGNVAGAIGNWAEVKAQALTMLGIRLTDFNVHNAPMLLVDQYGKFIPSATGFAQVVTAVDVNGVPTAWVSGTAGGLDLTSITTQFTGHAFLNDIAHHAAPSFVDHDMDDRNNNGIVDSTEGTTNVAATAQIAQVADSLAGVADDHNILTYDDEMLNAHFITGDGRGNENIALTTVHSIFHSEHNRAVDANKATLIEAVTNPDNTPAETAAALAFLNEWLITDVASVPADLSTLVWDGERLFQAARFTTEMQYQHMVFEEFARRIQPMVDPFIFNTSPDVDPSIVAEFAHTVYRFGHSMLTGTVDRLTNGLTTVDGAMDQATLLAVFLNPQAYIGSGATLDEINGNIIRGLSRDVGNAIDEFIVQDVRSNLLGLPLDLAMFNLSRGRETGIPSLNDTRAQLYNDTGLADLKPYESWADFALNIKNAASVVNFIAAYGTHISITSVSTLAEKRAAAELLVFGGVLAPADRLDFLNATGAYAPDGFGTNDDSRGGLNFIDLWIGGLAEKNPEFGGMLGTTFNYVFEYQMEALQFGDRMYYLSRTQGTGFLNNLEPNTFSDIVMRNTALGDVYSTHLNGALFTTPDYVIELDRGIAQTDYNGAVAGKDPVGNVVRDYTGSTIADGTHDVGGYLRVFGGNHYVLGGTEGNDRIYGDSGIDTLWGDGGNDYLNGGTESDDVFGGTGDDIIEDPFGDDVLRGNQGNDVITSARGADLLFGDQGQDYLVLGQDASEVFGGTGDDFILGGMGKDFLLGNEGNDWMEGGGGFDTLAGENSELFFNSPLIGHDVMFGQGDESDYDAESGDDIMVSAPSVVRNEGMFGFDWAIAKFDNSAIRFDLQIPIFTTIPEDVLRDRFDQVEALSGWKNSDQLDGDDRGHKGGGSSAPDSVPTQLFADHLLTQEGIDRIDGLNAWFAGARNTLFGAATPIPGTTSLPVTTYRDGNILMGGDGNDFLRGRGGYDILDGDAWLNVRIAIHANADGTGPVLYSAESMSSDTVTMGQYAGKVYNINPDGSPNFASVAFGGASLTSLLLDRTINPGQMTIVREILDGTPGGETDNDTAIFQGNLAEYDVEGRTTDGLNNASGNVLTEAHDVNGDGFISVRDRDTGAVGATINVRDPTTNVITQVTLSSRGALTDDTDLLKNIELLRFADQTIRIAGDNNIATGVVTIGDFDRQFPTQSTTFDLDGLPATPPLVTPYVGQVLTASLSGVNDLDGFGLNPVTFQWQTTEIGSNAGWTTITTGTTYTVRSVDPGHILRAVAVFNDNLGAPETIISAATDGATVAFSVNENATTGTVVASSIPFSPDYDPDQTPGGPTDGDITALTHVLRDSFGGRYQLVTVGGVQQVQVLNGGPVNFDYETNNEHQIVIDSYIDAATAAALDPAGRIASRQFTVLLNDINPEVVGTPPTDIQWNGVTPGDGITGLGNAANGLPGAGTVIANLSTVDANNDAPYTYALVSSTSPTGAFTVNATTGAVTRTGVALAPNATYTLDISSTDATGGTRVETFTIRTGTNSVFIFGPNGIDTITAANNTDHIIYGSGANDSLTGAGGNDNLFGQAGNDTLSGGTGNDILVGGGGNDSVNGGDGNDTIRYTVDADGTDAVNGGANNDTLVLTSNGGNQNLQVTLNAAGVITNFEGGTVTNVESITADLGGGTDTLTYTSATAGVTVNLATGTATGFTSIANIENVTTNGGQDTLTGNGGANVLSGGGAADVINGGGGGDTLNGDGGGDTLNGEAGNDILVGGGGLDIMTGGADNDVFDFNQTTESGNTLAAADVVTDFATGLDDIDVSSIDANLTVGGGGAGGQAFSNAFGANGDAFTAAGQMRFTQVDTDGVGGVDSTLLRFNTDANAGTTEFAILLRGYLNPVVAGDFIL